jgi:hypothetical protein
MPRRAGWDFTEHCCRRCLGPILVRGDIYICAICRAEAEGSPEDLCGCGIRGAGLLGYRRGGFRCIANPAPSPANPAAVLIAFGSRENQI